jgi:PTS system galactitol-specific IIA component
MSLAQFLPREAVALQVDAASSEEVIRLLGERLYALGRVKDGFVAATLRREADMPTGLPLGDINAAIPHVDIEYVNSPSLALATLTAPVIFRNMVEPDEEVPVRLIIMLALDQPKSQIEMLQQVSGVLQQPDLVRHLVETTSVDEALTLLSEN